MNPTPRPFPLLTGPNSPLLLPAPAPPPRWPKGKDPVSPCPSRHPHRHFTPPLPPMLMPPSTRFPGTNALGTLPGPQQFLTTPIFTPFPVPTTSHPPTRSTFGGRNHGRPVTRSGFCTGGSFNP